MVRKDPCSLWRVFFNKPIKVSESLLSTTLARTSFEIRSFAPSTAVLPTKPRPLSFTVPMQLTTVIFTMSNLVIVHYDYYLWSTHAKRHECLGTQRDGLTSTISG